MSAAGLRLELDASTPAATALAGEERLLAEAAAGAFPVLRVWECAEAIVVPRRRLRSPGDRHPRPPLLGRASGGSAVALGPGVVCVSLALPLRGGRPEIDAAYRLWISGVGNALRSAYGVAVSCGRIPGAFCDGAYNAVVAARKLAGTAQARRGHAALVHGCLLVDVDRAAYCAALAELGEDADPDLVTTLREEAGRGIERDRLVEALLAGFAAALRVEYWLEPDAAAHTPPRPRVPELADRVSTFIRLKEPA